MMMSLLRYLVFVFLLSPLAGCSGSNSPSPPADRKDPVPTPTPKPEGSAPNATPMTGDAAGTETSKVPVTLKEPDDPLVSAVKALPMGKVRVEFACSQPAGKANVKAEYECTILARFVVADKPETGYTIQRVVLQAGFEKAYDGEVFKAGAFYGNKPGWQNIGLRSIRRITFHNPGFASGSGSYSGGLLRPGTAMTFTLSEQARDFDLIKGELNTKPELAMIGVGNVQLDDVVKPLFKGPETFDVPTTVELLQIGDKTTTLQLRK